MCRDGEEETGYANLQTKLPDVFDVLHGGKPHPDHYGIDYPVERSPEPGSGPGIDAENKEFAALFAQCDDQKGKSGKIKDRMAPGLSAGVNDQFLEPECRKRCQHAEKEGQQQLPKSAPTVLPEGEDKKKDGDRRRYG